MNYTLLLSLVSAFLLFSCKKQELTPVTPVKTAYHLTHSGEYAGDSLLLNTNDVTAAVHSIWTADEFIYKYYDIDVWVKGPALNDTISADTTMSFTLSLLIEYEYAELNQNGTLPVLSAQKVAQAINNQAYQWNDDEERKLMYFTFHSNAFSNGQWGGNSFIISNPVVHASGSGNDLQIWGSVDSLTVRDLNWETHVVTGFQFDYSMPVLP